MKFQTNNIEDLRHHMACRKIEGDWSQVEPGRHRFVTYDGAIMDFWPKTRTIRFQGTPSKAWALGKAYSGDVQYPSKPAPAERPRTFWDDIPMTFPDPPSEPFVVEPFDRTLPSNVVSFGEMKAPPKEKKRRKYYGVCR